MSGAILTKSDIFRAERLFSERVSTPIPTSSLCRAKKAFNENTQEVDTFNKSISRVLNETKLYRIVNL